MTWQILQRQQSLCCVAALSLRLQLCSWSVCRGHFLYSPFTGHPPTPCTPCRLRFPPLQHNEPWRDGMCGFQRFLRQNFITEKVKFMDMPTERQHAPPPPPLHRFHKQQPPSCSYTSWEVIFHLTTTTKKKGNRLLPGFNEIQFSKPLCRRFGYNNL